MKFDLWKWSEVNAGEEIEAPEGRLRLRCSAPAAVYVTAQGHEVLAAVGQEVDLTFSEAVTYRVDGPQAVRVFQEAPVGSSYRSTGEVFTNIDRKPHESGTLLEVRAALRRDQIERRAYMREVELSTRRLRKERELARGGGETAAAPAASEPVASRE